MEISGLRNLMRKVDVVGIVKELEEAKTVNLKAGGTAKIRRMVLQDSSGNISLTLWNEDCDLVHENSIVTIANGYVSEFKGKLQLNRGKFGKISVQG